MKSSTLCIYLAVVLCCFSLSSSREKYATGGGDPHFWGYDGVYFTFHGTTGYWYNFFSDYDVQINAHFVRGCAENHFTCMNNVMDFIAITARGNKIGVHVSLDNGQDWADINGNIIPTEYGPYQIDDEILLRSQSLNVTYDFVNTNPHILQRNVSMLVGLRWNISVVPVTFARPEWPPSSSFHFLDTEVGLCYGFADDDDNDINYYMEDDDDKWISMSNEQRLEFDCCPEGIWGRTACGNNELPLDGELYHVRDGPWGTLFPMNRYDPSKWPNNEEQSSSLEQSTKTQET